MTIQELINKVDMRKPNSYEVALKVDFINAIEGRVYEVIRKESFTPYTTANLNATLSVDDPYCDLYIFYLMAQIDTVNEEFDLYNNHTELFNKSFSDYAKYYVRTKGGTTGGTGGGVPGPQGPMGPQGPIGPRGEKGERGEAGPPGTTGDRGPQGIKGDRGDSGPQGPQGLQGIQGDRGYQGIPGPQGIKGDKGDRGYQGPKGDKGDRGYQGENALMTNIKGELPSVESLPTDAQLGDAYKIDTNIYVWTGVEWLNLGNIQGPKGDRGDRGPQGPEGVQGANGPKGDRGPQGPQGPQGTQGPKGDVGNVGAKGETGPKGPQGDRGPQGTPALNYIDDTSTATNKIWSANKTNTEINSLKSSVSNGKKQVANAITAKGVATSTNAEFATMATNIGKIPTETLESKMFATAKAMIIGDRMCFLDPSSMTDYGMYSSYNNARTFTVIESERGKDFYYFVLDKKVYLDGNITGYSKSYTTGTGGKVLKLTRTTAGASFNNARFYDDESTMYCRVALLQQKAFV